jgi:hypothetical protein
MKQYRVTIRKVEPHSRESLVSDISRLTRDWLTSNLSLSSVIINQDEIVVENVPTLGLSTLLLVFESKQTGGYVHSIKPV